MEKTFRVVCRNLRKFFGLKAFLLRDIIAFGSITFPAPKGIKVITLFKVGEVYPLHFLATIPGTLIVLGLIFALFSYINRKLMILRRVSK